MRFHFKQVAEQVYTTLLHSPSQGDEFHSGGHMSTQKERRHCSFQKNAADLSVHFFLFDLTLYFVDALRSSSLQEHILQSYCQAAAGPL